MSALALGWLSIVAAWPFNQVRFIIIWLVSNCINDDCPSRLCGKECRTDALGKLLQQQCHPHVELLGRLTPFEHVGVVSIMTEVLSVQN